MDRAKTNMLREAMQFDHVIRVLADGTVAHPTGHYAPEVYVEVDSDGQMHDHHERDMMERVEDQGWELVTGWTNQYLYHGSIMHASEYIGGNLAEHILETPGYYVVVAVETMDDHDEAAGWAIAFKEAE